MMDFLAGCLVRAANRKAGAGYFIVTTKTTRQAVYKCGFATAQVAYQLYNFAALKIASDF